MSKLLPTLFPVATRVINAVRNVDPPRETNVAVRPVERPSAPQLPELPNDLHDHPVMRGIHQIMAAHTQQLMDRQDQIMRELGESRGEQINISHYVDKKRIDNSYRADSRVDARRYTDVDARHIEAKKRLHSDWGIVLIIVFLLGLAIIGTSLKNSAGW